MSFVIISSPYQTCPEKGDDSDAEMLRMWGECPSLDTQKKAPKTDKNCEADAGEFSCVASNGKFCAVKARVPSGYSLLGE
jgi:hypothetical protein